MAQSEQIRREADPPASLRRDAADRFSLEFPAGHPPAKVLLRLPRAYAAEPQELDIQSRRVAAGVELSMSVPTDVNHITLQPDHTARANSAP